MADWEKHVVPDWVVDDYNSRVPKEDRLPLRSSASGENSSADASHHIVAPAGHVDARHKEVSREQNTIDRQIDNFLARIMIVAVGIFLAVAIWASL